MSEKINILYEAKGRMQYEDSSALYSQQLHVFVNKARKGSNFFS